MGKSLARAFMSQGHRVRILALASDINAKDLEEEGIEVRRGDITHSETIERLCDGIDTVYHLAALILSPQNQNLLWKVNLEGSLNVIREAENASVRHFVYISSASVAYPRSNTYSKSKQGVELALKKSQLKNVTVVRPTLAYCEGGAQEFQAFVKHLQRFSIVPMIGNGKALKAPVYVDDISDGLTAILGNPKSYGKTYNFRGSQVLSMAELARELLNFMGHNKAMIFIPVTLCRLLALSAYLYGKIFKKNPLLTWQTISGVTQDAIGDYQEAQDDLNYRPRSFEVGLKNLHSLKNCLQTP